MELEGEKNLIGTYQLNIDSSRFHDINLKAYSELTLTVNHNNTFSINKQTSFLKSTTGQWKLKDNGDISFIEYQFENEEYAHQMLEISYWTFGSNDLKNSINSDKIIFTRYA